MKKAFHFIILLLSYIVASAQCNLVATLHHKPALCYGETTINVSVSVTGGTPGYTYNWSTSTTDSFAVVSGFSPFFVTVTDINNCKDTVRGEFAIATQIWWTSILDLQICFDSSYGNLEIVDTGGIGGVGSRSYGIIGFDTNNTGKFYSIPPGDYYYFIQDSVGCNGTGNLWIPSAFGLTVFTEPTSCMDANDGKIRIVIDSYIPQSLLFQYSLDSITFQQDSVLQNLSAGNHKIWIKTGGGYSCVYDTSVYVPSSSIVCNGLPTTSSNRNLNIYPNPVTSQLFIQTTGLTLFVGHEVLSILDINGRKLSEQPFASPVDVSSLAGGVYLLELRNKEGVVRKRWMKE